MVFTLVYLSTLRRPMSAADLGNLLTQSRARNQELGVTGLLVHRSGQVMQLLEGDEATVRALYAEIAADPRHHALLVVWTSTTESRRFPDWTMGIEENPSHQPSDAATGHPAGAPQSPQQLADRHGTLEQQSYARRRTRILQDTLVDGDQLIRTLAVLVHGHNPKVVTRPDGTTSLSCRECQSLTGTTTAFPCPTAVAVLDELEIGLA